MVKPNKQGIGGWIIVKAGKQGIGGWIMVKTANTKQPVRMWLSLATRNRRVDYE